MKNKMESAEVKQAIRVLKSKGVTIKQIEEVYKYYESLENKPPKGAMNSLGDFIL